MPAEVWRVTVARTLEEVQFTPSGDNLGTHRMTDFARLYMPTLDFVRALNERPWIVKLLFRLFVGRHAYSEFLFMVAIIQDQDYGPFDDYGLEGAEYHSRPQPWRWWKREIERVA